MGRWWTVDIVGNGWVLALATCIIAVRPELGSEQQALCAHTCSARPEDEGREGYPNGHRCPGSGSTDTPQ
jgi:hypothetical protein